MKIYELTTKLDQAHDLDWLTKYVLDHNDIPAPPDATLWRDEEWSLPQMAEDGPWMKLCGVNIGVLAGKTVHIIIETTDGQEIPAMTTVALGKRAIELVEKWKRSRNRDGDSEFMAGRRAGWVDELTFLLGRPWGEVRDALERGQL